MTTIKLHNTTPRRKEDFVPIDPDNVRMYVCGPTVYDRAHIGNARPVVVFDVLYRLLRHVYGAGHVTYVRNFTDVDDKINASAQARKAAGDARPLEALIRERTTETIGWYHADMDALGALRPNREPRATRHIGLKYLKTGKYSGMIGMIQALLDSGNAYPVSDGSNENPKESVYFDSTSVQTHSFLDHSHVLFDVDSDSDSYGNFSGRTVEDMIAGARAEKAPNKRNPADFVLWKPSDDQTPGWDSPWGRGRPGWHIECSAMSYSLLGASFDIHGGGIDLQFPHHENEIAQSRCAHPRGTFANYWVHNEMLQVEGKKMSKSLGNFFTVRDLLEKGVPGEVIRLVLLGTHYGKPMDWTEAKARQAKAMWLHWMELTIDLTPTPTANVVIDPRLLDALSADLNTHLALIFVNALSGQPQKLLDHARWMGFLSDAERRRFAEEEALGGHGTGSSAQFAQRGSKLHQLHNEARLSKDYTKVDAMTKALVAAGLEVRIGPDGVELLPGQGFDPAKLEALG